MKYDVILADPPWRFDVWSPRGEGRSASRHYPIMSIEAICRLPVADLAADNCALFLWTTWSTIFKYPLRVFEAWGFTYRTEAWIWVKQSDKGWQMGTGYYTRANSEPCLLAVKGTMPVEDRGVLALICQPRRQHSQKPDHQYELIERLYPGKRYLELFAREKRSGWHVWGNEVESDIDVKARMERS
jgi:N6-adenosine-specific RNA methylase IME4